MWLFVAASLLVLSVWLLYRETGHFDFLRFDDHDYTYRCAFVKDGLSWANVREAFSNARHGGIWMPVTYISYMADISLFGPGPGAHHLVNVAIHMLNAVLLFGLAVFLTAGRHGDEDAPMRKWRYAALALLSAFWALHPQRAEAVAWIASRKELLCTTFVLGGLLFWMRARRIGARGRWAALGAMYACFVLACMSKPTAMCFPFMVFALEGMLNLGTRSGETPLPQVGPSFKFLISNFVISIPVSVAVGALAVYSQTHPEGFGVLELYSTSLPWRLLNAAVAVGLYIFQMFVPVGIHLDYRAVPEGWPVNGALGLGVLALTVLCAVGAWWLERRLFLRRTEQDGSGNRLNRSALFLTLSVLMWFFASLTPTLGIFGSFGEHARADRFLYLPAMVVPLAAAMLLGRAAEGLVKFVLAALVVYVGALFAISSTVIASYRNDATAFERSIECDPGHGRALAHLGEARCAEGRLDEGIDMLRRSREVRPRDATDAKLAYALMRRGRSGDWNEIREICALIAKEPARDARGQAMEALGTAELVSRNWKDAVKYLVLSVRAPARHYSAADAILKLAFAQHNSGQYDEARKLFEWIVSSSGREDLARRARQVLSILEYAPHGLLFW